MPGEGRKLETFRKQSVVWCGQGCSGSEGQCLWMGLERKVKD